MLDPIVAFEAHFCYCMYLRICHEFLSFLPISPHEFHFGGYCVSVSGQEILDNSSNGIPQISYNGHTAASPWRPVHGGNLHKWNRNKTSRQTTNEACTSSYRSCSLHCNFILTEGSQLSETKSLLPWQSFSLPLESIWGIFWQQGGEVLDNYGNTNLIQDTAWMLFLVTDICRTSSDL